MEIEKLMAEFQQNNGAASLALQVFLVVFAALLLDFVQKRLLNRLEGTVERTVQLWDDAFLFAARRPLGALIWVLGITFAADMIGEKTRAPIFEAVQPIRDIGVILCFTWFALRLIRRFEQNMVEEGLVGQRVLDPGTALALGRLLRVSVVITAGLIGLQTLGFSISGALAFGGIGGVAVGFAAKDLLANFFGGLMIHLDRPFAVGDWIRSPDREIEGVVERIGWRLTVIRTFDKRPLYIPNSTFASIALQNPSRMTHRRIYENIGLRYDDAEKMGDIIAAVRRMLAEHPEIDEQQTLIVNLNRFAPSSLEFFIYTHTRTVQWERYHEVKQDVLLKVIDIITAHGAEIAFPTSTVHVPEGLALQEPEGVSLGEGRVESAQG